MFSFLKTLLLIATGFIMYTTLFGCASVLPKKERVFIDSSTHENSPPDWVLTTDMAWNRNGIVQIKGAFTIRGDERVGGCFDLARMDIKEALLSEIANDVRGRIDNAHQSISENAEEVLGKVRSGQFEGRIMGLRFVGQYYERYAIDEVERIDCHMLGEMSESQYNETKRAVVNQVVQVDPELKKAIENRQIEFFQSSENAKSVQQP